MRCARHDLAAGEDGRCALCHREAREVVAANVRHDDRRIHRRIRVVLAIITCLATFALLMAWLDTSTPPARPSVPLTPSLSGSAVR